MLYNRFAVSGLALFAPSAFAKATAGQVFAAILSSVVPRLKLRRLQYGNRFQMTGPG
jgi:hypothetical protein